MSSTFIVIIMIGGASIYNLWVVGVNSHLVNKWVGKNLSPGLSTIYALINAAFKELLIHVIIVLADASVKGLWVLRINGQ